MQAQLDQSIPKKTHEEIVARMQGTIDGMGAELRRTKTQLDETRSINESMGLLAKQVVTQGEMMKEVAAKMSEVTVPSQVYQQAATKIYELEQVISRKDQDIQAIRDSTVPKDQYNRLETRINELESILQNSMPKAEFEDLTQQIDSLAKAAPLVQGVTGPEEFHVPSAPNPIAAVAAAN